MRKLMKKKLFPLFYFFLLQTAKHFKYTQKKKNIFLDDLLVSFHLSSFDVYKSKQERIKKIFIKSAAVFLVCSFIRDEINSFISFLLFIVYLPIDLYVHMYKCVYIYIFDMNITWAGVGTTYIIHDRGNHLDTGRPKSKIVCVDT